MSVLLVIEPPVYAHDQDEVALRRPQPFRLLVGAWRLVWKDSINEPSGLKRARKTSRWR
jgi:hypothetical protein